jgi:hypothetical protein
MFIRQLRNFRSLLGTYHASRAGEPALQRETVSAAL